MIVEIDINNKKELLRFIRQPYFIYRDDPNWVTPLELDRLDFFNKKKNPFFEHSEVKFFIATKHGKDVGRITAHIDHNFNDFQGVKWGMFGFFETIDDQEIAIELLEKAEEFCRLKGMEEIVGPMNFNTNHECGLLVEGFDTPPFVMMTHNPPYYMRLLEKNGYTKYKDLYAYRRDTDAPVPEKIEKFVETIKSKKNIKTRTVNLKRFDEEVKKIQDIYNRAWEKNWGFVPMTDKEFRKLAEDLKMIVIPDLGIFAEVDNRPVGFSLTIPNINEILHNMNGKLLPFGILKLLWGLKVKRPKTCRLIILGVKEGYRRRGIEAVLYYETLITARRLGFKWGEISWTLEDNVLINRPIENMGGKLYKRYRIYGKKLS